MSGPLNLLANDLVLYADVLIKTAQKYDC